ncbi:hypothetical protein HMPREF0239_00230 [Clostridium sp. ATCC BAA-442]|nr:hypothetical protein HMPREF0239_00230 [Clostridium sp. ATCC BAA-442]
MAIENCRYNETKRPFCIIVVFFESSRQAAGLDHRPEPTGSSWKPQ